MPTDLIEQCRKHNRRAQLTLYRQYAHGMFCVAMRFVKNTADAEDITQEAFIKAFQRIDQFEGNVTFGAWLKRIVVNRSIDFLKSRKQQFVELQENRLSIVQEQEDWSVDQEVQVETVKAAMEELPDKYRYVVQLYLVEGYDHQEISEILDLRETTCRTRLMRGKQYLKELLNQRRDVAGS
ncbi:MAG: RNA polymerase sigma factor [Bacteroidetes bacterium]|nr:MAG: RNA polymerase sigma factor [Bacteroidota bacterium]UCE70636.1 MAG: RNA polymerase sigma factor [Flavobacteriaceae bacterium]